VKRVAEMKLVVDLRHSVRRAATRARRGQGVVEYAGALVVAAAIVGAAMFIVPREIAGMVSDTGASILAFLLARLPG